MGKQRIELGYLDISGHLSNSAAVIEQPFRSRAHTVPLDASQPIQTLVRHGWSQM